MGINEETIYDRLKKLITHSGLSQNKFAKKTGIDSGLMSNMLNGSRFGIDKLIQILNSFPEISSEWLLRGDGEILINTDAENYTAKINNLERQIKNQDKGKTIEKLLNYIQTLEDEKTEYKKGLITLKKALEDKGIDLDQLLTPKIRAFQRS